MAATAAFSVEEVFSAACAAHRINDEYVKTVKWPDQPAPDAKISNRELMIKLLQNDTSDTGISDDDRAMAVKVRKFYRSKTFDILQGVKVSDFDMTALALCGAEVLSTKYEFAMVASFPASYLRGVKKQTVDSRIGFATGGLIGQPKDKVTLNIEVLRSVFSQQWQTHYMTAITDEDHVVFFSYKGALQPGMYKIECKVKAHRDNQTQLNYVKLV